MTTIYQKIRKAFGSNGSVDSGCHDVQGGIGAVITSGTCTFVDKIGIKLDENLYKVRVDKEQTISNRNSASSSSSSSNSSSNSSSGVDDGGDCADGVIIREGAKITEVGWETYAHGFGLRDDDIIISVNNKPVLSAAMVASMIQRILKHSKNSQLRMEIHRRERGLIILDNGGDDVSASDDDELICIDNTKSKLKNVRYSKYLYATSSKIGLSNFRTPLEDKFFTIKHYAKVIGDADERFIALKHNKTNRWVRIDSGIVTLQPPPPGDGHTLPIDSNYLINVTSSGTNETLQPVNEPGRAIGFERRRRAATLISTPIPATNKKVLFRIYTSDSH
ncbi:---NA--- [Paramuricea clavata]|uniref:---NA n=1 Tax=Paramuricea clavata TaxID=317549 RepID=A0A6S7JB09_PARCT|nr:---NA--- [Paramuricea clavata]